MVDRSDRRPHLTFYVLRLQPRTSAGRTWSFEPHPGDLRFAEGAFTTALGVLRARWSMGSDHLRRLVVDAPAGTEGRVVLPPMSPHTQVLLDGRITSLAALAVGGGQHVITFRPRP